MDGDVVMHDSVYQALGVAIVDDRRTGLFVDGLDEIGDDIGDAAAALEHSDQLTLVVCDGKLPQGPRVTAHDDDDVARADVDYLPPHQTAARVDKHVKPVHRRAVDMEALVETQGRGDAHREAARG